MIRLLLLLLVLAVALLFALENRDQMIVLRLLFGEIMPPTPVYLVVLTSFAIGVLVAGLLVVPDWIRTRLQLRRQRRQIAALEERLNAPPTPAPPSVQPPRDVFPDSVP